jgi:hypothetical protein
MIVNRTAVNGKSCISFKQRTTEANYVYVYNDVGCFSYVKKTNFNFENKYNENKKLILKRSA